MDLSPRQVDEDDLITAYLHEAPAHVDKPPAYDQEATAYLDEPPACDHEAPAHVKEPAAYVQQPPHPGPLPLGGGEGVRAPQDDALRPPRPSKGSGPG